MLVHVLSGGDSTKEDEVLGMAFGSEGTDRRHVNAVLVG